MGKKVTMKDVANKVGVSTALVSYVLNGLEKEKRVGPEIAKKILHTAKEMDYKLNKIARSLRKGSTNTIGLIVSDISNPYFGQLAKTIEENATKYNYTVIFGSSDRECAKTKSLIDTMLDRHVDGFIIVPSEGDSEQVQSLIHSGLPVVLIDRSLDGDSINYVVLDNFLATYSATNTFISKGYTQISMIVYKSTMNHMQERIRGYYKAMENEGLVSEVQIKEVRYNHVKEDMARIMEEIFIRKRTNALLFATNALSISGLYEIKKHNIKVPGELGVICFDYHEAYDFFQPPVTYIQQPLEDMGRESVKILIEQIKGSKDAVQQILKHQLIERESSG